VLGRVEPQARRLPQRAVARVAALCEDWLYLREIINFAARSRRRKERDRTDDDTRELLHRDCPGGVGSGEMLRLAAIVLIHNLLASVCNSEISLSF
jgi:hypothetical protein